jgi:uncharacterized protein
MLALPERVGVGLGYHTEFRDGILNHPEEIDFVEVITERCFNAAEQKKLEPITTSMPVVCHGLRLSLGTDEALDGAYLDNLAVVLERLRPIWFSDHLSMSQAGGIDIGHLAPLPFTQEMVEIVCTKIIKLRQNFSAPFVLENITYYFQLPGAEMTEWEFVTRILDGSDCGMLLDLNNLYVNAKNHHYDAYEFLNSIPLERVVEVHLAGGLLRDGVYVDTHGHSVGDKVWEYLEFVCRRASVKGIVLERDQNFPPFDELLAELQRARLILNQ